jgi:hypothetical protein
MQSIDRFYLTILFTLVTLSGFSWQESFKEKVRLNEKPNWMLNQIRSDLEPFVKTGISKKDIDVVMDLKTSLRRFQIVGNQVFLNGNRVNKGDNLVNALCQLTQLITMPDVDFVISYNDSFYHVPVLASSTGPLFSFTKRANDQGIILFPDHAALAGYIKELNEVKIGNAAYPWDAKEEKAFWRGATSGFLSGSLKLMGPDNYEKYPRIILCQLSKYHPDFLDAGLNPLVHVNQLCSHI